jgi:hypothetical protein
MLIDLAKIWKAWFAIHGDAHNIAEALRVKHSTDLATLEAAHDANVADTSPLRVEAEKEAREILEKGMIYLKKTYLTKELCTRMELKELHLLKDNRSGKTIPRSPIPARVRSAEPITACQLRIRCEQVGKLPYGIGPEDYVFVVAFAPVVPEGTVLGPGAVWQSLPSDPTNTVQLLNQIVVNGEYETLVCPECYRGCKMWFAACMRNKKNEDGDYGSMMYTYVP